MPTPLAGVLPVFQTPYHDDESIDFETLRREIDWLAVPLRERIVKEAQAMVDGLGSKRNKATA